MYTPVQATPELCLRNAASDGENTEARSVPRKICVTIGVSASVTCGPACEAQPARIVASNEDAHVFHWIVIFPPSRRHYAGLRIFIPVASRTVIVATLVERRVLRIAARKPQNGRWLVASISRRVHWKHTIAG